MSHTTTNSEHHADAMPVIAVLAPNTLMGLGLRTMLERLIPVATTKVYSHFDQIADTAPEDFFHLFVSSQLYLEHAAFFQPRRHKTIVLTTGASQGPSFGDIHTIDIMQPEQSIEQALRTLHHTAHGDGATQPHHSKEVLTTREIEVLTLLTQGLLNKQIADTLGIGITTVISHRKNIIEKLGIKSVSGLTIYAVMKGYIEAGKI